MYGMEVTLKVCEAYNEVQRIKEELQLLPREMEAHLQYWAAVIDKQDALIAILLSPAAAAATTATDLAQRLQAGGMQVRIPCCCACPSAADSSARYLCCTCGQC